MYITRFYLDLHNTPHLHTEYIEVLSSRDDWHRYFLPPNTRVQYRHQIFQVQDNLINSSLRLLCRLTQDEIEVWKRPWFVDKQELLQSSTSSCVIRHPLLRYYIV